MLLFLYRLAGSRDYDGNGNTAPIVASKADLALISNTSANN